MNQSSLGLSQHTVLCHHYMRMIRDPLSVKRLIYHSAVALPDCLFFRLFSSALSLLQHEQQEFMQFLLLRSPLFENGRFVFAFPRASAAVYRVVFHNTHLSHCRPDPERASSFRFSFLSSCVFLPLLRAPAMCLYSDQKKSSSFDSCGFPALFRIYLRLDAFNGISLARSPSYRSGSWYQWRQQ